MVLNWPSKSTAQTPIVVLKRSHWQQQFTRFKVVKGINLKQTLTGNLFGGLMKNTKISHFSDGRSYCLADEKMISFNARKIQIECRQGVVWVTWPDGNERVLKRGQAMTVVSKGLIIVQALSLSTIVVRSTKKEISQLYVPCRTAELPAR